ncbi:hypothetical protein [Pseudolactococcus insecticola]|uniref:Uncharacterized protein n=1 Tax=Pseudolactococcus insecticola TaxID=2709158 RepID=A0A6A0B3D1_9LACT|nr:hypothetical protein [Lactococcus insecticola]GFH39849.1 hypothetical protein Hs20B_02470 [Lactococcus insecticola]
MAYKHTEHTPLFMYNAIRKAVEETGLTLAEAPETHDGSLPYAWIDQINGERSQIARRSHRAGDIYNYTAVVHVFYPWERQGDMLSAIYEIDGRVQEAFLHDMTQRIFRESDGVLHGLININ